MDTVSIDVPAPAPERGIGLRVAGAALAATAIGALGAGYALGLTSATPEPSKTVYVGGSVHTWGEALRESIALKQNAAEPRVAIDVRHRRLEK